MDNVPKLRFEGFTDAWERCKLGDLAIFNPKSELPDVFEYVDLESVIGTEMISHRTETRNTAPSRAQRLAQTGDLFYQTVRPYQKNNYLFEKADKHFVFSTGYAQMRPLVNGRFLLCLVQNDNFVRIVLDSCTGTSYPAINSNDLAKIDVHSPREPQEQKQIGDFFKNIDNLITLHQRKCKALETAKRFYLQNMIPKKAQISPTIRIGDFSGKWEKKKFGDIVERYEDPVPTPHGGYERLGIRSHAKGTFHSYVEEGKELETAQMHRVAANNFIVNITFGWEHAVAITSENDAGKLVSHRFPQYKFNNGMLPDFFRYLIIDKRFKHHLSLSSPGGAGRNRVLNLGDMLLYEMLIPSADEQKEIAAFLSNLDTVIDFEQRKVKALKTTKKFLLQNMFV